MFAQHAQDETGRFVNNRVATMFMPAWKLITLPRARIGLPQWTTLTRSFRNLDTTVQIAEDASGLRYGQVMWASYSNDNLTGIAWDWREVQKNVVAMFDPMAVQSNVELLDDLDAPLTESQQLLYLNRAIHSLPWQDRVCALWRTRPQLRVAA